MENWLNHSLHEGREKPHVPQALQFFSLPSGLPTLIFPAKEGLAMRDSYIWLTYLTKGKLHLLNHSYQHSTAAHSSVVDDVRQLEVSSLKSVQKSITKQETYLY
jgi:hypothetical protein